MRVQVTLVLDIPETRNRDELNSVVNELEVSHPALGGEPIEVEVIEYELLG